jgi:hypothetical protein
MSFLDDIGGFVGGLVETALPMVGGALFGPVGAIGGELLADPAGDLFSEVLPDVFGDLFGCIGPRPPQCCCPRPRPWTPPCDPGGPGGPAGGSTLMEKLIALIGKLEKDFEGELDKLPEKPNQKQMAEFKLLSDTFNQNVQLAMGVIDANGKLNSSIAQKIGTTA